MIHAGFLYPPSQDSVVQVTPVAFAACQASDPVLKLDDGNSVFNLTTPGRVYYISAAPGHCRKGQRLAVDVPMANGTYLPPTANDLAAFAPMPAEAPAGSSRRRSARRSATVGGARARRRRSWIRPSCCSCLRRLLAVRASC